MVDKNCILQVFGCLMQRPLLLGQTDKYNLTVADFSDRFSKRVFAGIYNLFSDGAKAIHPIDIENALSLDVVSRELFKQQNGIDYLTDAEELADVENFDYYYNKLKKINLLNDLQKSGYDTSEFYCEDLANPRASEINRQFEELSIEDIVEAIKKNFIKLTTGYLRGDTTESSDVFEGVEDLLESLAEGCEIGEALQGEIWNQIVGGAVKGKLYIRSGSSGLGKSRQAVGDACYLAFPVRFNERTMKWEATGNNQKVLFIATEQTKVEIQRMILAYLTDINESKFKYNTFTEEERTRVRKAVWVLKNYKDNFIITQMPSPTIELMKTIIRENCLLYGCEYVFFDYIFISPAVINEFRGVHLRNDEVLLMMSTALKDLAVELNVFVMTSTQLNANADDNERIRNEATLAGGRSTINKADVGAVMARPAPEELKFLEESGLIKQLIPNMVTDIFKVRSGEWTQVRIWSYVDLGTLKKEDLFLTNSRLEIVENFNLIKVQNFNSAGLDENVEESLSYLND